MKDKKADLAGPGIGDYDELEKILPNDYSSLLTPKETQQAVYAAKNYIEENLCKELNLMMVTVPLIVDVESGVNDYLDRDGSRTPIGFHISNDYDKNPIDNLAPIVAAKIPILHIVSENDRVVPPAENTYLLKRRLEQLGGAIEIISVAEGTTKSNGHHFEHPDVEKVVDFIVNAQ